MRINFSPHIIVQTAKSVLGVQSLSIDIIPSKGCL